jgi:propionyl-CoA synthetase
MPTRTDPLDERLWSAAAAAIDWSRPPSRVIDRAHSPTPRWFPDGELNTCHNAIDRHVEAGRGGAAALICDSMMTGVRRILTFAELRDETARAAGMLLALGVQAGDRVVIYMPMIAEAVVAMLACARIGAIHSVVFGGFAPAELAKRIDDARPRAVLTASCGLEPGRIVAYKPLLDRALSLARHSVVECVVLQRPELTADLTPGRDRDWREACAAAAPAPCTPRAATDPLYILYTSGTTGTPKGVVRDNGGHAVALAWSMANVYGVAAGDTFWAASDIGWVVGHSYIVYAPLIVGSATVLYEGKPVGTPDAGAFWRVALRNAVDVMFTAPTALRAIRREDPDGAFIREIGTGRLRALFLAGERADPETVRWAERMLGIPIVDHWWQTELGWPAIATCLGRGERETRLGSAGRPVPGFRFNVLDPAHRPLSVGEIGEIAIELPLPPGCLPTLWENDEGFVASYLSPHPGHYTTGDAGFIDEEGFVHVMGRTDDIINVAGHRLSTGAIEQLIAAHPDVAECAVVGAADSIKGQVPVGFLVLKSGAARPDAVILAEVRDCVRDGLGPVASFRSAAIVANLPKTRSGKVLRSVLRRIADGERFETPATIEDPAAIDRVRIALENIGLGGKHAA